MFYAVSVKRSQAVRVGRRVEVISGLQEWLCRTCCQRSGLVYSYPCSPDVSCSVCRGSLDLIEHAVGLFRALLEAQPNRNPRLGSAERERSSSGAIVGEARGPEAFSAALPLVLTVAEAQRLLGCSRTRVFQLLRSGELVRARKLGKATVLMTSSVLGLLGAAGGLGGHRARSWPSRTQNEELDPKLVADRIARLSVD